MAMQRAPSRTMFGSIDLSGAGKAIAMIGRLPTCDIVLPYPQVSGRHTSVMKSPDGQPPRRRPREHQRHLRQRRSVSTPGQPVIGAAEDASSSARTP
jgi:pSer/pThr/pTyr-binding forkhead associated (FHA) protein